MPTPEFNIDNFVTSKSRQMTPEEAWKFWQAQYKDGRGELAPWEARGYRIAVIWRLTRSIMVQQGRLSRDQRICDIDDILTPSTDPKNRQRFCELLSAHATSLYVSKGTKQNPQLGHYGLQGLLHPDTVREFWPSRAEILYFEDSVIEAVKARTLREPRHQVMAHFREQLGLEPKEATALMKLAVSEAQQAHNEDLETKRFLAEEYLDGYIARARENGDLNSEMKALKLLHQVQGLTRVEPENQMDEMVRAIGFVAQEAQKELETRNNNPIRLLEASGDDDS